MILGTGSKIPNDKRIPKGQLQGAPYSLPLILVDCHSNSRKMFELTKAGAVRCAARIPSTVIEVVVTRYSDRRWPLGAAMGGA